MQIRRLTASLACALLVLVPTACTPPTGGAEATSSGVGHDGGVKDLGPTVRATHRGPTGYKVTFRYDAPKAKSVRIQGQWYLSDADHSSPTRSEGRTPASWKPGDFPLFHPASTDPGGPVREMKKDEHGIWTYTTPLPPGTWNYGFYEDCDDDSVKTCDRRADPAQPPWNVTSSGKTTGSRQSDSQVYVPSDPDFKGEDLSWQAPVTAAGRRGRLLNLTYSSPGAMRCTTASLCASAASEHDVAVYLPPGYDADRARKYPTIYLSHGNGGNELVWSTEVSAGNILDRAITGGKMQPVVVVMVNWNHLRGTGPAAAYRDLTGNVIPFVESRFNVSERASQRALGGLSAGGERTDWVLTHHPEEFGYYGIWSTGGSTPVPGENRAGIDKVLGLQVGGGRQDPITARSKRLERNLRREGVEFRQRDIDGGHDAAVWRDLFHDFLVHTAFH